MKVYKVEYWDAGEGCIISWHSSKIVAEQVLRGMVRSRGESQGPSGVTLFDVPTDKIGLLHFLNTNVKGDS